MKPRSTASLLALLLSAACAATLSAAAPPAPPGPGPQPNNFQPGPGPRNNRPTFTLTGKVASFNKNPRGEIEGLMLDTPNGLVQLNMPYEIADQLKKLPVGEPVEATVGPDNPGPNPQGPNGPPQDGPQNGRGPRGGRGGPRQGGPLENQFPPGPGANADDLSQPLFPGEATTFIAQPPAPPAGPDGPGRDGPRGGRRGQGPDGPSPGRGPRGGGPNGPDQDFQPDGPQQSNHPIYQLISLKDSRGAEFRGPQRQPISVESTLKALNYGQRGAVNGLQLANGDFVRLNPQGANDLHLAPNAKVAVKGMSLALPDGSHTIDPETINGQPAQLGPPQGPPNDFQNGPDNQRPNDRPNAGPNRGGPGRGPDGPPQPNARGQRGPGRGPRGNPPPDADVP